MPEPASRVVAVIGTAASMAPRRDKALAAVAGGAAWAGAASGRSGAT